MQAAITGANAANANVSSSTRQSSTELLLPQAQIEDLQEECIISIRKRSTTVLTSSTQQHRTGNSEQVSLESGRSDRKALRIPCTTATELRVSLTVTICSTANSWAWVATAFRVHSPDAPCEIRLQARWPTSRLPSWPASVPGRVKSRAPCCSTGRGTLGTPQAGDSASFSCQYGRVRP